MRTASFCSAISLFVFALAGVVRAQAPAAETERRTIAVSVVNRKGISVEGLKPENFKGTLRGEPVKILSVEWDRRPRRIVLLVDTSASMSNSLETAWAAARLLVRTLGNANGAALFTFDDRVERLSGFLQPPISLDTILSNAESQVRPKGGKALLDGIMQAIAELQVPQFGDVIVVFTDGRDNSSRARESEVKEAVARAGVRVFFVGLIEPIGYHDLAPDKQAPGLTSELIEISGGISVVFDSGFVKPNDLGKRLRPLYACIVNTYRMEIEFLKLSTKMERLNLEKVDEGGKKDKDAQILYPHVIATTKR